jgi:hypothetical protein
MPFEEFFGEFFAPSAKLYSLLSRYGLQNQECIFVFARFLDDFSLAEVIKFFDSTCIYREKLCANI